MVRLSSTLSTRSKSSTRKAQLNPPPSPTSISESQATPHVTGLISYLLSFKPGTTPSAMSATIRKMATFGALDMKQTGLAGGLTSISNPTPNYLIYDGGLKFRLV